MFKLQPAAQWDEINLFPMSTGVNMERTSQASDAEQVKE